MAGQEAISANALSVVGLVAGLGAAGFFVMLDGLSSFALGYLAHDVPNSPGRETPIFEFFAGGGPIIRWALPIIATVGGLVSGVIIFCLAPEAEGHGTDAAIEAYHFKDGMVRARVPLVKCIASMITIGTGGSGGREGPIAQIGSGFASVLGRWFRLTPAERRVLMGAGMAAGIGAIFHAPLAGALFAAEVLYQGPDLEYEMLVPGFITSLVAYTVFGSIFGFHPLFITPDYHFKQPLMMVPYLLLGVVSALGALLYVRSFYGARKFFFQRLSLPNHFKPAIGGLITGLVAIILPEALGTGYGVVQACFNIDLGTHPDLAALPSAGPLAELLPSATSPYVTMAILLALIALAKIVTTSFSIGSGGSGGVFGPAVVIGGALGGSVGFASKLVFPDLPIEAGAFTVLGMAGFFAGAANTPISTILMVSEMTGSYNLLLPAMLVCITSFAMCSRFTLYEKQLPSRLDAPAKLGSMARSILRSLTVDDAIALQERRQIHTVRDETSVQDLLSLMMTTEAGCFPVPGGDGRMTGIVYADDLREIAEERHVLGLLIAVEVKSPVRAVTADATRLSVVNLMAASGRRELVVVEKHHSHHVAGTVSHADILATYDKQFRIAREPVTDAAESD